MKKLKKSIYELFFLYDIVNIIIFKHYLRRSIEQQNRKKHSFIQLIKEYKKNSTWDFNNKLQRKAVNDCLDTLNIFKIFYYILIKYNFYNKLIPMISKNMDNILENTSYVEVDELSFDLKKYIKDSENSVEIQFIIKSGINYLVTSQFNYYIYINADLITANNNSTTQSSLFSINRNNADLDKHRLDWVMCMHRSFVTKFNSNRQLFIKVDKNNIPDILLKYTKLKTIYPDI